MFEQCVRWHRTDISARYLCYGPTCSRSSIHSCSFAIWWCGRLVWWGRRRVVWWWRRHPNGGRVNDQPCFAAIGHTASSSSRCCRRSRSRAAAGAGGDSAAKEIGEIKASYTPGAPGYKFQYLLLNVVDNPAQRIKPGGVDEMRWRQALAAAGGADNPDRLWPVAAHGFRDLTARSAAQAAAVEENASRLRALQDLAHRLAK